MSMQCVANLLYIYIKSQNSLSKLSAAPSLQNMGFFNKLSIIISLGIIIRT